MDKETAEWVRIFFPKTFEYRIVKMAETLRDLFFWWRVK